MRSFKDIKISTKMIFIVIPTFLLIILMILFNLVKIFNINNEMNVLNETGLPLMEIVNNTYINSLESIIHIENMINKYKQIEDNTKRIIYIDEAKEIFFHQSEHINSEIERGRELLEYIYQNTKSQILLDEILMMDYELRNIKKTLTNYQFVVEQCYDLILQNNGEVL